MTVAMLERHLLRWVLVSAGDDLAERAPVPGGRRSVTWGLPVERGIQSGTTLFLTHEMACEATGCWSSVTKSCEESVRYSVGVSSEGSAPNLR